MKKTEFKFILNSPITHHKAGDTAECTSLRLVAPSYKNRQYTAQLTQTFMRAMKGMEGSGQKNKKEQDTKDDPFTRENIIAMLLMSDIDICTAYDNLKNVLLHEGCFLENDKQMTKTHFEQLVDEDLQLLLGDYIANFLIPSWMIEMMQK
jgi:hypothetical protein